MKKQGRRGDQNPGHPSPAVRSERVVCHDDVEPDIERHGNQARSELCFHAVHDEFSRGAFGTAGMKACSQFARWMDALSPPCATRRAPRTPKTSGTPMKMAVILSPLPGRATCQQTASSAELARSATICERRGPMTRISASIPKAVGSENTAIPR